MTVPNGINNMHVPDLGPDNTHSTNKRFSLLLKRKTTSDQKTGKVSSYYLTCTLTLTIWACINVVNTCIKYIYSLTIIVAIIDDALSSSLGAGSRPCMPGVQTFYYILVRR